jgi:hypothetical protein
MAMQKKEFAGRLLSLAMSSMLPPPPKQQQARNAASTFCWFFCCGPAWFVMYGSDKLHLRRASLLRDYNINEFGG